jgi:hypothetical protein
MMEKNPKSRPAAADLLNERHIALRIREMKVNQ